MGGDGPHSDEAARREAHRWSMRMHGDDAPAHREAFELWRAAHPRNAAIYEQLERQREQAGLLAHTRVGQARSLPDRRRPNAFHARYAVALAVIILTIGFGLWLRGPAPVGGDRHVAASQIASRIGEIRKVALPDGSVVTLDTDSIIQPVFSAGERRIILTHGRARFSVAHDVNRPFVVLAGGGAVIAHGTVFDVRLLEGRVSVTLLSGAVDVRHDPPGDPALRRASVTRLSPGERTSFSRAGLLAPPRPAPTSDSAWTSGMLSFDAARLEDAIAEANRYSLAKIRLSDPATGELRITGAYRASDTAGFARALAASFGLDVTTDAHGDIVLDRPTA